MGKLHRHMAKSAETDHANLLACGDAPMTHGGVGRDTGTEERRGSGEIEIRRDAQDETLIDDDAVGIAPVGDAAEVLVGGILALLDAEREEHAHHSEVLALRRLLVQHATAGRVSYRLTPWVPNNQNAEVSHNTIRMANSTPPAMGSAQPG